MKSEVTKINLRIVKKYSTVYESIRFFFYVGDYLKESFPTEDLAIMQLEMTRKNLITARLHEEEIIYSEEV